jgi:hypothetical protein
MVTGDLHALDPDPLSETGFSSRRQTEDGSVSATLPHRENTHVSDFFFSKNVQRRSKF